MFLKIIIIFHKNNAIKFARKHHERELEEEEKNKIYR